MNIKLSFVKNLRHKPTLTAFLIGFHSVPSMRRLHCHLLSADLESPMMKNKRHFNSYSTDFFIPLPVVVETLRVNGFVEVCRESAQKALKSDLRCHRCQNLIQNFPALKRHLSTQCVALLPSTRALQYEPT